MFVILTTGHCCRIVAGGTKVPAFMILDIATTVTAPPAAAASFRKPRLSMLMDGVG